MISAGHQHFPWYPTESHFPTPWGLRTTGSSSHEGFSPGLFASGSRAVSRVTLPSIWCHGGTCDRIFAGWNSHRGHGTKWNALEGMDYDGLIFRNGSFPVAPGWRSLARMGQACAVWLELVSHVNKALEAQVVRTRPTTPWHLRRLRILGDFLSYAALLLFGPCCCWWWWEERRCSPHLDLSSFPLCWSLYVFLLFLLYPLVLPLSLFLVVYNFTLYQGLVNVLCKKRHTVIYKLFISSPAGVHFQVMFKFSPNRTFATTCIYPLVI